MKRLDLIINSCSKCPYSTCRGAFDPCLFCGMVSGDGPEDAMFEGKNIPEKKDEDGDDYFPIPEWCPLEDVKE